MTKFQIPITDELIRDLFQAENKQCGAVLANRNNGAAFALAILSPNSDPVAVVHLGDPLSALNWLQSWQNDILESITAAVHEEVAKEETN